MIRFYQRVSLLNFDLSTPSISIKWIFHWKKFFFIFVFLFAAFRTVLRITMILISYLIYLFFEFTPKMLLTVTIHVYIAIAISFSRVFPFSWVVFFILWNGVLGIRFTLDYTHIVDFSWAFNCENSLSLFMLNENISFIVVGTRIAVIFKLYIHNILHYIYNILQERFSQFLKM